MAHMYETYVHKNSYYSTRISDVLLDVCKASITEGLEGSPGCHMKYSSLLTMGRERSSGVMVVRGYRTAKVGTSPHTGTGNKVLSLV